MPNLLELHDYAVASNNEDALYITTRYKEMINDKYYENHYYIGGILPLKPHDNITDTIIKEIQSELFYAGGDSWNSGELITLLETRDVEIIIQLIEEIRLQKLRMKGLLRAIVFWLSPARKRAAEYVFHPSRMQFTI